MSEKEEEEEEEEQGVVSLLEQKCSDCCNY